MAGLEAATRSLKVEPNRIRLELLGIKIDVICTLGLGHN